MTGFSRKLKSKEKRIKNINISSEKIINQAFLLHTQGNIKEAAKYYQYLINQGVQYHSGFSNY